MKPVSKQHYARYLGLVGLISLLASAVAWGVLMTFGTAAAVLSIIGLLCVVAYVVLDFSHIQAQLRKRSVKYGANTTVMILVVLGIIVLVEAISLRHNVQFDVTKNKRYTLSEQTKKLMASLAQDVTVTAFYTAEHGGRPVLEDLLRRYNDLSPRLKFKVVDPVRNPARAQAYGIARDGTIVLETAEKQKKIFDPTEEALTNGLIKVTREGTNVVYFISGHGERALEASDESGFSLMRQALGDENYEVKDLLLLQEPVIPGDATVVVLAGPQKDLLPNELDALTAYIERGGRLLCMFDPGQARATVTFLETYGLTLHETTVIDPNPMGQLMGAGPAMPIASTYQQHPITENFTLATIFPLARSMTVTDPVPEGVSVQPLASSGPQSWAETSQEELLAGNVSFTEGRDPEGPLTLTAVVTVAAPPEEPATSESEPGSVPGENTPAEARIVVFGDSDFASNAYIGWLGNADLVLNAINWLAEEEDLIAIRAQDPEMTPLVLTAAQARMAFLVTVILMPLAIITIGVTVYINRRKVTR